MNIIPRWLSIIAQGQLIIRSIGFALRWMCVIVLIYSESTVVMLFYVFVKGRVW